VAIRKFNYYLKCHDGRLLYAEGACIEEAVQAAGVSLNDVKRHMPVEKILTEEEKAERVKKFQALKEKKAKEDKDKPLKKRGRPKKK